MKKPLRTSTLVVSCIVVIASSIACGSGTEAGEFELTEWDFEIGVTSGAIYLNVYFRASGDVTLSLTYPEGTKGYAAQQHYGSASFQMASGFEVPKAGQYTLTVENQWGRLINTTTFDFAGPSLAGSDVSLMWIWNESLGYYTLEELGFALTNGGDLPAWVARIDICIDGKCETIPASALYPATECFPGGFLSFRNSLSLDRITPGEKILKVGIRDSVDQVVCTYSSTVMPSA